VNKIKTVIHCSFFLNKIIMLNMLFIETNKLARNKENVSHRIQLFSSVEAASGSGEFLQMSFLCAANFHSFIYTLSHFSHFLYYNIPRAAEADWWRSSLQKAAVPEMAKLERRALRVLYLKRELGRRRPSPARRPKALRRKIYNRK
jgi:hypothetical protein